MLFAAGSELEDVTSGDRFRRSEYYRGLGLCCVQFASALNQRLGNRGSDRLGEENLSRKNRANPKADARGVASNCKTLAQARNCSP